MKCFGQEEPINSIRNTRETKNTRETMNCLYICAGSRAENKNLRMNCVFQIDCAILKIDFKFSCERIDGFYTFIFVIRCVPAIRNFMSIHPGALEVPRSWVLFVAHRCVTIWGITVEPVSLESQTNNSL